MKDRIYKNKPGFYSTPFSRLNKPLTDKCIVLDLDQTLIATQDDLDSLKEMRLLSDPTYVDLRSRIYKFTLDDLENPGAGTAYDFWGILRPHTAEFMLFCFSYFKIVTVWSAGKKPYVEAIVDYLCKDLRQPDIILTHNDIIMEGDKITKPLVNMITANEYLQRNMFLDNTYALDDNITTYSKNIGNGILIPAYEPALTIEDFYKDDQSLLQFKKWLMQPQVMYAPDITKLDKSNIFI